ncbi:MULTISPECIES: LysE family translocator [unclassified Mesorhizobium]|uniref:LysE family translocator n=1 Tax=unclassified Mesorhizobium TaxID=325217 RepID=UPI001126A8FA|nr:MULTISPECIES: LysE family translocator [unclassified Mesorhizobium]TPK95825.1 LysE family translocator [Mesorhizobium sp. B2-4-16]TPL65076.1 LysE family translocator [Mesorhizobium sp. B2-4-3]
MSLFLAFLGVSFIVLATPGPDTAITIRNTLLGGRMAGVFTALGISSGQTIWALATSAGIVALLVASEPLFLAVKYAGAAYLIYLGVMALQEALRPPHRQDTATVARPARRLTAASAYRQGLISDLGNPKMAVFFASLLPQFVPPGGESFSALLGLGAVFAVMTFTWLALYATVVAKAGDFLRRPSIRRTIEGLTGMVLIGLGIRIATEHR